MALAQHLLTTGIRLITRDIADDTGQQRQRRIVLAGGGAGQIQALLGLQQRLGQLALALLELALLTRHPGDIQIGPRTELARRVQRLDRLPVLDGSGLLHIQRLLVIGQLAFQAVNFAVSQLFFLLQLGLLLADLLDDGQLLFQPRLQLADIFPVLADLLAEGHGVDHAGQLLGCRLQLVGQVLLARLHLLGLFGQIDGALLLFAQQAVLVLQLTTRTKCRFGEPGLLGAVAHVIGRHIVGGFGDQVAEQIALRLGFTNRIQGTAVLVDRRLHVLERLAHTGVLRQQVFTQ